MTKQRSLEDILSGWDGLVRPNDGQRFRHYKGGEFVVVATGYLEDTESACVAYRSLEKNIVWVRTAKNFLEQIEHDGIILPRFAPLDN